ncbi:MAG: cyclic pyranopterin monophosphate synthase MoaC [Candidatus Saliniplasma sp.]
MIDISEKKEVHRTATAEGTIILGKNSLDAIDEGTVKKGDPIKVAEISAIQAVKRTPYDIPHCHPIPIESVDVNFTIFEDGIKTTCTVKAIYKTGVEMEALSGVNSALLTIWDMVKYLEKDEDGQYPTTRIENIRVSEKKKTMQ